MQWVGPLEYTGTIPVGIKTVAPLNSTSFLAYYDVNYVSQLSVFNTELNMWSSIEPSANDQVPEGRFGASFVQSPIDPDLFFLSAGLMNPR